MNSNRDPMLAPGHDGMMLFDSSIDDSLQGQDVFLGNAFADQGDLMDDMFATSPQSSTLQISKDQPSGQPSQTNTVVPPTGSSPEDSSEDSSSDDSARHQRKSSSLSFQTDVDMDGTKFGPRVGFHQPTTSSDLARDGFAISLDSDMVNQAMANDFDFDSAASSPDHMKSPIGSSTVMSDDLQEHAGKSFPNDQAQMYRPGPSTQVKTESIASQSPSMSNRKSPVATTDSSFRGGPSVSGSPHALPRVHIHPIPPKSRVETQIPMKITIMSMPEGAERLHLPTHTISKPKLIARPTPDRSPDMLELHSMLVCTSAMQDPTKRERAFRTAAAKTREMEAKEKEVLPREESYGADDPDNPLNGGEVHICRGCVTRERKRAARKKSKKPEDEAAWASDEARRVVVFNTTEVRQWEEPEDEPNTDSRGRTEFSFPAGSKQIKMPMRIACYCRHHSEKMGFQVIITLKDHQDQVVGQAMTAPIIITDDHKAQPLAAGALATGAPADPAGQWSTCPEPGADVCDPHGFNQLSRNAFSSNDLASLQMTQPSLPLNQSGFSPFASAQAVQYEGKTSRLNRSRQPSPASSQAKRRKTNGSKLPESLMMTKAQATSASPTTPSVHTAGSLGQFANSISSPFGFQFPAGGLPLTAGSQRRTPSFPSGPPTPDSSSNDFWANGTRAQSFDTNAPSQPMMSAPSSRMQSRAPSPSAYPIQTHQSAVPRPIQGHGVAAPQTQPIQRAPIINKIVPGEGPIAGGIEVTCLGSGFFNGLEVVFGNSPATTTTYWGETTLVCLLPPADRPGVVPVTFKHNFENFASAIRTVGKQTFTYVDDEEQELFKHAFIALTQKMTGRTTGDPVDFARKALGVRETSSGWAAYPGSNGQHRQIASGDAFAEDMETTVMKCLELIDMDDSPYPADFDLQRSNGQTLLHLAASLGYQRLVAALLARGAEPDLCDHNGFSPLHFASLRNHAPVARRLRFAGANPILRSRLGYIPAQLTTDSLVLQVLDSGIHLRSRSFGASSLTSRTSSLQSLALATPPRSRANSLGRYAAQDGWDSSSDEDDEDDLEPLSLVKTRSWRQSRRSSTVHPEVTIQAPAAELHQPATTAAALVAWRDQLAAQIQHFQQSVEGILPHLQMPTLPTIPPLTGMPNYQAPAMVRRFSSLVPQRSSRPSSPAESTGSSKDGDSKWWHIFPGSQSTPSSPPPYNEIYPEETERGLDDKAQAVASAQARNAKIEETTVTDEQSILVATSSKTELSLEQEELKVPRNVKGLRKDTNFWLVWMA